jgi:hypothetical protein
MLTYYTGIRSYGMQRFAVMENDFSVSSEDLKLLHLNIKYTQQDCSVSHMHYLNWSQTEIINYLLIRLHVWEIYYYVRFAEGND